MTQDDTYRARAQTVRLAARAQLLEMRRTRLAKRSGTDPVAQAHVDSVAADDVQIALAEGVMDDGPDDLADTPLAQTQATGVAPPITGNEHTDQATPSAAAASVADVAAPVAPPPVPKPKRKAVAYKTGASKTGTPKPDAPKPGTRKAEPSLAVAPDDAPEQAPAMFVPRPRVRPDVLSRPVMAVPVLDAEDLSVLAAAMSEIEDDRPEETGSAPDDRPAALVAAHAVMASPVPEYAPAPDEASLMTRADADLTNVPPEPELQDTRTDTDLVSDGDSPAASEGSADSIPDDTPDMAGAEADLTDTLADPLPEHPLPPRMEMAGGTSDDPADVCADMPMGPEMAPDGLHASAPGPEPVAEASAPTGLYALPGAGPGLIWMLGQVGIDSMEDLARADADDLGRKLGLVGQILNVGSWVEFARSADGRSTAYQ
jgi:hypothetical protein